MPRLSSWERKSSLVINCWGQYLPVSHALVLSAATQWRLLEKIRRWGENDQPKFPPRLNIFFLISSRFLLWVHNFA